jgi:hypothetical protein
MNELKSEILRLAAKIVVCPGNQDPHTFHRKLPKTTPVTARRMIIDALCDVNAERKGLAGELRRLADKIDNPPLKGEE